MMQAHSYEAQIRAKAKAIRQRLLFGGCKAAAANQNAPVVKLVTPEPIKEPAPLWHLEEIRFEAHVWAWSRWKADQCAKVGNHVVARCAEIGIPVDVVKGRSQKRAVVVVRDALVYEIKSEIAPHISWAALGKHFDRDHTSVFTAYHRGAAAAGDPEAIAKTQARRIENARRHRERNAKARHG